jgi:hypothetical protein
MSAPRPTIIEDGRPVDIYWNLHKDCFSVRARTGRDAGRVIAHIAHGVLRNARFVVNQGGRKRVIAERRKNVHAFIRGEWAGIDTSTDGIAITYNPYLHDTFVEKHTGQPVLAAEVVHLVVASSRPIVTTGAAA